MHISGRLRAFVHGVPNSSPSVSPFIKKKWRTGPLIDTGANSAESAILQPKWVLSDHLQLNFSTIPLAIEFQL